MTLVCKSSPRRQIHSPQQNLFYSFEWLHFKGPCRQQPHAGSHVWTLLVNYLSKPSLERILRQNLIVKVEFALWLRRVPPSDSSQCADARPKWLCLVLAQKSCDTHPSEVYWLTECQAFTAWAEGNISPLQSNLEGFKAKLFLDKGKIFYFARLRGQDLNICNLLSWLWF